MRIVGERMKSRLRKALAPLGTAFKQLFCKHPYLISRMRWVEEYVDYYDECGICGMEFFSDD